MKKKMKAKATNKFSRRYDITVGEHGSTDGKFFVASERWEEDGTWWKVTFAAKRSWVTNMSHNVIAFRDKAKAEAMAAKMNKLIGW